MIEGLVQQIKDIIGDSISDRVYASIVPEFGTFPCLVYQLINTDPYYTKDAADRSEWHFRVWIYVKDTVNEVSASTQARALMDTLRTSFNKLIDQGTEYRLEDESEGYEEGTELWYSTADIIVQSNYP